MAIYYIDPHTTTNGTGTFASPWSLSSATRTGLTDNDEIRIKGVALTSLLTATTYTVTYATATTLTVTAGGGLGADFAANNIVYFPANGAFARIASVASNTITIGGTFMGMPWYNTSAGQTTITLRRVNTTTYGVSLTGTTGYIYDTMRSGLTISDCWVDVSGTPTRFTDGTVKTLISTSSASTVNYYIGNGTATRSMTGSTVTLPNTAFICGTGTTSGANVYLGSTKSTYTIGQVYNPYLAQGLSIGAATALYCEDMTVTVTHYGGYYGPFYSINCYNLTLTFENVVVYTPANWYSYNANIQRIEGTLNLTIKNVVFLGSTGATPTPYLLQYGAQVNLTMDGPLDYFPTVSITNNSLITYGNRMSVTFTSNYILYSNRRTATRTVVNAKVGQGSIFNGVSYDTTFVPDIPTLPTGWTATYDYEQSRPLSGSAQIGPAMGSAVFVRQPRQFKLSYPSGSGTKSSTYFVQYANGVNTLFTYRDGSSPIEILCFPMTDMSVAYSYNVPVVSTDAATFRTTGPSLKAYLETLNTSVRVSAQSRAQKLIRIPITSGTTYAVAGYIRTNIATVANGDCVMYVYFNNTSLGSQSMTTACYNAWEAFSIGFTATYTGEAVLVWDMYHTTAGSFWLDDLTIT